MTFPNLPGLQGSFERISRQIRQIRLKVCLFSPHVYNSSGNRQSTAQRATFQHVQSLKNISTAILDPSFLLRHTMPRPNNFIECGGVEQGRKICPKPGLDDLLAWPPGLKKAAQEGNNGCGPDWMYPANLQRAATETLTC